MQRGARRRADAASNPARHFVLVRQPSVRRQMIDDVGQILAEALQQFVARQAALRRQRFDLVGAERAGEIAGRDLLVGAVADPGIGGSPWPFCWNWLSRSPRPPLRTLPAAPPASSPPNPPLSMSLSPPPAPPPGRLAVTLPGSLGGAGVRRSAGLAAAEMLDRLPGQQRQDRHGHRRHPAALSDCALGVLGPRGPFCMPLSTSSKPMVVSCRVSPA